MRPRRKLSTGNRYFWHVSVNTLLEAASVLAVRLGSPTRKSVKSILESGRDLRGQIVTGSLALELPVHGNVRGPGYYH